MHDLQDAARRALEVADKVVRVTWLGMFPMTLGAALLRHIRGQGHQACQ